MYRFRIRSGVGWILPVRLARSNEELERRDITQCGSQGLQLVRRRDECLHPAIAGDMSNLVGNQDRVDRHIYSARLRDGKNREDLFNGGIEIDSDAIATLHTRAAKSAGKRGAPIGDFAILQAPRSVDKCFLFGMPGCAVPQHVVDQKVHRVLISSPASECSSNHIAIMKIPSQPVLERTIDSAAVSRTGHNPSRRRKTRDTLARNG